MGLFQIKYKSLTDEQLMEYVQKHDTKAFNELYKRYSQRILSYFFRSLGGNEDKAQDFLQDLFLKIVEKPYLFYTDKKFSTWIFTIAHNLCKNEYRRLDVRKQADSMNHFSNDPQNDYHDIGEEIDRNLFKNALFSELSILDGEKQNIFLLRYQQHFSVKEISEIMEIAEGTVKSRLFYITKDLASKLKDYNPY